jgi:hypothetical protein
VQIGRRTKVHPLTRNYQLAAINQRKVVSVVGRAAVNVRFGSKADIEARPFDVRFSNRPVGVKRFQTHHDCGVDVTRGLALLFGLGAKALPSWDSRTGGTIFTAALP